MTAPQFGQLVTKLKMTIDDDAMKSNLSSWWRSSWPGIVAEFLSTLLLVLFGCMTCIPVAGIDMNIYSPLGFGFIVLFNTQIFGHISGAYMNPVVTLASVIFGRKSISVGIMYVIAEFIGALVGYGILITLSPVDVVAENVCVSIPHVGLNDLQSMGVTIALTATLIFINCSVWDPVNAHKQDSVAIMFGLTKIGLNLVGGPLTDGSMNPARSFAPALWTGYWTHQWVYWVGPCLGSLIAVTFYKFAFLKRSDDVLNQR